MTNYSVFSWSKRGYDYYQAPGLSLGDAVTSAITAFGSNRGIQIERVLGTLPEGAKYVGFGCEPIGRIVVYKREQIALGDISSTQSNLPLFLGLAVFLVGTYIATKVLQ